MKIGPIDQSKLAKTDQDYLNLLSSKADWIARTADDVKQLRQVGDGPLAKLPESDFHAFLTRLKFNHGGVASGYYKPLMSSLTLTGIFEVFERFGMSREYAFTAFDRECLNGVDEHCETVWDSFCTSACGRP
jgi:hypothetical protein